MKGSASAFTHPGDMNADRATSSVRPRGSGGPDLETIECLALGSRFRGNERRGCATHFWQNETNCGIVSSAAHFGHRAIAVHPADDNDGCGTCISPSAR